MNVIEHDGVISSVDGRSLKVEIVSQSACAACHARGQCISSLDSAVRVMEVTAPEDESYTVGERVRLSVTGRSGILAVVLCYIVPLVACIVTLALLVHYGISEGISAAISLALVAVYMLILFTFRRSIARKVDIKITHYKE